MSARHMMRDADELLARLSGPSDQVIEDAGATAVFAAIAGAEISAVMHFRQKWKLTAGERKLLQAPPGAAGHKRDGMLYAGRDIPVAATTAVLLPCRTPGPVCSLLGIAESGGVLPALADIPLGRVLRGYGIRREALRSYLTPGLSDDSGNELVMCTTARLWLDGSPVALVTERVLAGFLSAFPGPW
jgi:hypothetical protein